MSKSKLAVIALCSILVVSSQQAEAAQKKSSTSSTLNTQLKYLDQTISSIKDQVLASNYDSVTVHIDPQLVNSGWAADATSNLTTALKLMNYFGYSSSSPLNVYLSLGPDYKNKFIPTSCQYNSGGGSCGNGIMFGDIKWFTDMWGWNDQSKSTYPDESTKLDWSANLPHEIGHVLQESSGNGTGSQGRNLQPAWLREGAAEFFKLATYSIQNNVSYSSLRTPHLKYWRYCKGVKVSSLTSQGSYPSSCEYTVGLVAFELLIIKEKSLKPLYLYQQTPGSTQSEIFKNAFGFSQDSFQREADKYFVTSTANVPSN
ncbi:MAG: hypothetical protein KGM39_06695 [Actinomycetales bacterium]|nr:hypothetical protein [Actinomycetales bacterium]